MQKIMAFALTITLGLFCLSSFAQTKPDLTIVCKVNPKTKQMQLLKVELTQKLASHRPKITEKTLLNACNNYYNAQVNKPTKAFTIKATIKRGANCGCHWIKGYCFC